MLPRTGLSLGLFLSFLSATQAGYLISSATGGYTNEIDYGKSSIEWMNPAQPLESRLAAVRFAADYLQFAKNLGPAFRTEFKASMSGLSAEEAIAKLEKITGTPIPRKIKGDDKVKISLKGSETGTVLLLKIISLSGMTPSFETGTLVLSVPSKTS